MRRRSSISKQNRVNHVRSNPRFIEYSKRVSAKRRSLNDAEFVIETERTRSTLERAFRLGPQQIRQFFAMFPYPSGPFIPKIQKYLASVNNEEVRAAFDAYLRYVSRFGACFLLDKKKSKFSWRLLGTKGAKFSALLTGHELAPRSMSPPHLFDISDFEAASVEVNVSLEKQIKKREAKFLQISDKSLVSLLSQIEELLYEQDTLAFIVHRAERPYLFLMVGERVGKEVFRRAQKTITAFQRELYGRAMRGRKKDASKLRKVRNSLGKGGPAKVHALTIMPHNTAEAAQNYYSATKKVLKGTVKKVR